MRAKLDSLIDVIEKKVDILKDDLRGRVIMNLDKAKIEDYYIKAATHLLLYLILIPVLLIFIPSLFTKFVITIPTFFSIFYFTQAFFEFEIIPSLKSTNEREKQQAILFLSFDVIIAFFISIITIILL